VTTLNTAPLQDEYAVHARFDAALWRRILAFGRPYLRQFALLAAIAALVALCDVAFPLVVGWVIDEVTQRGGDARLEPYALAFAAVVLTLAASVMGFIALAGWLSVQVCRDIRRAAFAHLQQLHLGYFDHRPIGWLMSRLTSDCNLLSRIMGWSLLDLVWGVCTLTGIAAAMLVLNWRLGLAVLVVAPPLVLASRWFQWRLLVTSRRVRRANSHLTASFNEALQGARTTKSLVREERNLAEFRELSSAMFDDAMRHARYAAAFWPVLMTLCAAATGVVLWYGGLHVLEDTFTLGQLVTFLGLVSHMMHPIQEMARSVTMILGAQAGAERIAQVLQTVPEVRDRFDSPRSRGEGTGVRVSRYADSMRDQPVTMQALTPNPSPEGRGGKAIGRVAFEGVTFAYDEGAPVLVDCSFTVEAGQTIALVGQTGGGKSTIVSLLCRFYEPRAGRILIDGVEYRDLPLGWYQAQLGVVPQAPQLFNDTIRENIRYGRLDATDAEVEHAAEMANADVFIRELPGGYDAKVGEGGNQLSTGQKQLVALARAFLNDPCIFVMDEATSSVDTETEKLIQSAVERVLADRIAFVIAHRLSTIRNADLILVVEAGRIVERGTHHDLLAAGGRYHALCTHQFTEENAQRVLAEP